MTVWGVSSTRDEADILDASTRHMLAECDHVLVEEHCSTDDSSDILATLTAEFPNRLHVLSDPDPAFHEEATMRRLTDLVTEAGAQWVVPFDTDEVWTCPRGRLRDVLPRLDGDYLAAVVYEHVPRPSDRGDNPLRAIVHRRVAQWAWGKVALRTGRGLALSVGHHEVIGQGHPAVVRVEVRHFPWRSQAQARRRVARNALAATGSGNAWNYRGWDALFADAALFAEWWEGLTSSEGLVYDPAPVR